MRKFLVLGGSGFIGRKIVSRLSKDNKVVVADICTSPDFESMKNVTFETFDFLTADSFETLLSGVDTVIHLISTLYAKDGTENLEKDISENVFPTIRLINSMVGKDIDLLFVSSGGTVYGEVEEEPALETDAKHPYCSYALIKIMIEDLLELYQQQNGLRYKIVRLSNPYGFIHSSTRTQGLIPIITEKIIRGEPISIWGDGGNIRDYIYLEDAIDAIFAILGYKGPERIFNVGSGVGYSIKEIVDIIIRKLSPESSPLIQYGSERICDLKKSILNIEKISKCTGWRPKTDIECGIDLVIEEFKRKAALQP